MEKMEKKNFRILPTLTHTQQSYNCIMCIVTDAIYNWLKRGVHQIHAIFISTYTYLYRNSSTIPYQTVNSSSYSYLKRNTHSKTVIIIILKKKQI